MKRVAVYLAVTIAALGVASAAPEAVNSTAGLPMRAPNFRLIDTKSRAHELAALKDCKALVLFVQMNGCPIVRQSYPYFEEIRATYESLGIAFLYVNSNPWDTDESIDEECKEYSVTVPVMRDRYRALAHVLGFTRSAETFVIDPKSGAILYRGMADDRFDYGLQRMSPSKFWLRDVLEATVHGELPEAEPTIVKGCVLELAYNSKPDFALDVMPLLSEKFATIYGVDATESAVRANPEQLLGALLTGRVAGREVLLTDDEGEALAAWLFSPSVSESQSR